MSRFRKVDPRFWKDEKIIPFPPMEKLIALYLFTGQSNRIGLFSFSPGEAAEDLSLSPETFRERFGNVCRTLKIGWDETFRVLYLPTWWKYNVPENANNVIGNLKDLDGVPDSPLIERFINNLQYLSEELQETFTQTLAKRYPQGYPKRSPSQEQEQEQEKERVKGKPSPSKNSDPRIKELFSWWDKEYQRRIGEPYAFNGSKEGKLIKDRLRQFGLPKLKSLALSFLDSKDPWVQEHGGYTIGVFVSQINKLISTAKATDNRPQRKEMPK